MRPRLLPALLLVLTAPALAEDPPPPPPPPAAAATPEPAPATPAAQPPAPAVEAAPAPAQGAAAQGAAADPAPPPPPAPAGDVPPAAGPGVTTFIAQPDLTAAPRPPAEPPPAPAPAPAAVAEPAPPPPPPAEAPLPKYGLRLALGLPDAATASMVFRPVPPVRVQGGLAWNYLGFGLQAGVTVTPIRWAVSPVFEAGYGHFFGTNLKKVVKSLPAEVEPLATSVGYDYFSGQVALEFGSPRGYTFSVGLGLSYLWTTLHGTATVVKNQGTPDEATVTVTNPSVRAVIPSLRLGMLYYF